MTFSVVETISNHVKWLALRMLGSYLCSGHFGVRLDWDRPHERTEPNGKEETSARDVETSSNYYPIFSSCPLASTAACPPASHATAHPSKGQQLLPQSHPQRSQAGWVIHFHALFGAAAASGEKMQTTISTYSEHTANRKQNTMSHEPFFIFILSSTYWLNILPRSDWLTCWHDWWYGNKNKSNILTVSREAETCTMLYLTSIGRSL